MIEARSCLYIKPARQIDVVLHEHSGNRESIRKARNIDRLKTVALDRDAAYQGMLRNGTANGQLREPGVAVILLDDVPEYMFLPLRGPGPARVPDDAARRQRLN